ncbi:site-specific DNA-methyltransferase [Candidatus Synechococcus calcipolaris G9]|uniref:Methyltransferase n=1 Tax=Candidatus Synechococcus calcipolaris G9 TaxID=1497997 RepID=A0ABT6EYS3_9SYNE|nr:site-specific DNA-methyltransferase [Candidatus Synechococcus calcipolaris]MDG2990607.1 site-specific DNA-methyltransferase [Candidatus Synechococcus calcipolaris G9]
MTALPMTSELNLNQTSPELVWTSADGESRLYHGNSLELMAALPAATIDCIWTDPPYNLSNDGFTCVAGRMVKVNKGEWDRSQGVEMDHAFNKAWLAACYRLLKPTGTIWVTGTLHVYPSVGFAMQQLGFRILNDIIWEKTAPPPNLGCRCFTHATELILWATKARKGKESYTFNYQDMKAENGDKQMKNVWRMSTPRQKEKAHGKHPTQKPLELVDRCLRASTHPGDIVLDPFAGSATTGVASLSLGRRFIGCEADANFVELSIQRLNQARR